MLVQITLFGRQKIALLAQSERFTYYLGCNHDGVIARHGIVSHHPQEEKPRKSFPWYSLTTSLEMKPRL